jgi:hypothetical protein
MTEKKVFGFIEPTKANGTLSLYLKDAESSRKRYRREMRIAQGVDIDNRSWAGWLIQWRYTVMASTWRRGKSAAIYWLENQMAKDGYDYKSQTAIDLLKPVLSDVCLTESATNRVGGSKKLKKLSISDFNELNELLQNKYSHLFWSNDLRRWLLAGMLTGLRPVEWSEAKLIENENQVPYLLIQNAKSTNNRSHGMTRTIHLPNMKNELLDVVRLHLQRSNAFFETGQYDSYQKGCVDLLKKCNDTLWPKRKKRVTLYSARHQFSADAKSSGLLPVEVAALMGHGIDSTAATHYAKSRSGQRLIMVAAEPSDVERVKHDMTRDINRENNNFTYKEKVTKTLTQNQNMTLKPDKSV